MSTKTGYSTKVKLLGMRKIQGLKNSKFSVTLCSVYYIITVAILYSSIIIYRGGKLLNLRYQILLLFLLIVK